MALSHGFFAHARATATATALFAASALALACAAPAPVHRSHLGALLDTSPPALDPTPQGRTDSDRQKAQALLADGARLRDAGDLPASAHALEQALQLDASLARAHVEWALTAEGLGVSPELINAHYQLGARLAPDDARAQTLAAAWAARQGDSDRALEGYDRALSIDPKSTDALARKGDLLEAKNDHAGAVTSYQQALALDAKYVPALIGMSDAAEHAGRLDVAEKTALDLVAALPDVPLYRTRLIEFYRRTNQPAKAAAAQRELDKLDPKDSRHLRKLRR
ncbi:MAG TPA: tetratricopeptide repeat protein [Myxococcota bacterium]